jgi:hypothetical protein
VRAAILSPMADQPAPIPTATVRPSGVESAVAETMRRVHEELRRGSAPTFEALLAFGEPA